MLEHSSQLSSKISQRSKKNTLSKEKYLIAKDILVQEVGHKQALVLQELTYRLQKGVGKRIDGRFWIEVTQEELCKKLHLRIRTLQRYLKNLEEKGYILRGYYATKKTDRTHWYALPSEEGEKRLDAHSQNVTFSSRQNCDVYNNRLNTYNILRETPPSVPPSNPSELRSEDSFLEKEEGIQSSPPPVRGGVTPQEVEEVVTILQEVLKDLPEPQEIDRKRLPYTLEKLKGAAFGYIGWVDRVREYLYGYYQKRPVDG